MKPLRFYVTQVLTHNLSAQAVPGAFLRGRLRRRLTWQRFVRESLG